MAENIDRNAELDWDSEFTAGEVYDEFVVLPEGVYPYRVLSMERGEYTPGPKATGKIKAGTKMLTLNLQVDGGELGTAEIRHNLFMLQWAVNAFFVSAGLVRPGETISLKKITEIPGSTGWCRLGIREWEGNDKKKHQSNQVKNFLDPEKVDKAAANARAAKPAAAEEVDWS